MLGCKNLTRCNSAGSRKRQKESAERIRKFNTLFFIRISRFCLSCENL